MSFTQGLGIWRNKMKNVMLLNLSKPVEHLVFRDKTYHNKSALHWPDTQNSVRNRNCNENNIAVNKYEHHFALALTCNGLKTQHL